MKNMFILATIMVAILLSVMITGVVFAQPLATVGGGERSNLGPDASWQPGVGPVEEPNQTPVQPEAQPKKTQVTPKPRVPVDPDDIYAELPNIKKAAKIVLTGQNHGKPGPRGHSIRGPRGERGERGLQGHQGPPGKDAVSQDWSWLRWLLVIPLLILLWPIATNRRRIRDWPKSLFVKKPKEKPEPDATNTLSGSMFDVPQKDATIKIFLDGVVGKLIKAVLIGLPKNGQGHWHEVESGQELPFNGKFGQTMQFYIGALNTDPAFPMSTKSIVLQDNFTSDYPHEITEATWYLGSRKLRNLNETELLALGKNLPIYPYGIIDAVPYGKKLTILYQVRFTSGLKGKKPKAEEGPPVGEEKTEQEIPVVTPEFSLDQILADEENARLEAEAKVEAARKAAEAEAAAKKKAEDKKAKAAETKKAEAQPATETTTKKTTKKSANKTDSNGETTNENEDFV